MKIVVPGKTGLASRRLHGVGWLFAMGRWRLASFMAAGSQRPFMAIQERRLLKISCLILFFLWKIIFELGLNVCELYTPLLQLIGVEFRR